MNVFPIGTSRLHEPLSLMSDSTVQFPGMGYFHSSSQVVDIINVIARQSKIDADLAKWFFRKDQTQQNKFDAGLWGDSIDRSIDRIRDSFMGSDRLIIEVSSPRSYRLFGLHVQGNPNYYRSASYGDVWKEGYYKKFNPELDVLVFDDYDSVRDNLRSIDAVLSELGKKALVIGHLVDPRSPNAVRVRNNSAISCAVDELGLENLRYYDQSHLVAQFGFRVLDDGSTDIHHLPWAALEVQAAEITELLGNL